MSKKKSSKSAFTAEQLALIEKYKQFTGAEHVRALTMMYIDDPDTLEDVSYLEFDSESSTFSLREHGKYNEGIAHCANEAISNSYDHFHRDGTNVTTIKVDVDPETLNCVFYNNGAGLDVAVHPESYNLPKKKQKWIPQMMFAEFRSSSNESYTGKENGTKIGQFGIGIKAVLAVCDYVELITIDAVRGLKYTQTFAEGLKKINKPSVRKFKGKPFTQLSCSFDPLIFSGVDAEARKGTFEKIRFRTYEIAAFLGKKCKVYFNDELSPIRNFESLAKAIMPKPTTEQLSQDFINQFVYVKTKDFKNIPKLSGSTIPTQFEFVVASNLGAGKLISYGYVNGVAVNEGTHLNVIINQITSDLIARAKKQSDVTLTAGNLESEIFILVNLIVSQPKFHSQQKSKLTNKVTDLKKYCKLEPKSLNAISKLSILSNAVNAKSNQLNAKVNNATKTRRNKNLYGLDTFEPARLQGKKAYHDNLALIITEGNSAKQLALDIISNIDHGKDFHGIYACRGKVLNGRDETITKVYANKVWNEILRILGIEPGLDYNLKENRAHLRYSKLIIMADQDVDGFHITGLVLNTFEKHFSGLCKSGFIKQFITPVVCAIPKALSKKSNNFRDTIGEVKTTSKSNKIIDFFSEADSREWQEKHANEIGTIWTIKYFKGLATSNKAAAKRYAKNLDRHLYNFEFDNGSGECLDLIFNKTRADDRKEWLRHFDKTDSMTYEPGETAKVSEFCNTSLKEYGMANNHRALVSVVDGLKESGSKIVWTCATKSNPKIPANEKVSTVTATIIEYSSYHHGPTPLEDAMKNMAKFYPTSPMNIPLLEPDGQFGSRFENGKDAGSSRYVYSGPTKMLPLIFHKTDIALCPKQYDDGREIEPRYLGAIIPLVMINWSTGIGSGHAGDFVGREPMAIVNIMLQHLKSKNPNNSKTRSKYANQLDSLTPWRHGFTGTINSLDCHIFTDDHDNEIEYSKSWEARGKYVVINPKKIRITEIPWQTSFTKYRLYLESICAEAIRDTEKTARDQQTLADASASTKKGRKGKARKSTAKKPKQKTGKQAFVKSFSSGCIGDTVDFEIELVDTIENLWGCEGSESMIKALKLRESFKANYTAFDREKSVITYNCLAEIYHEYFDVRYQIYADRRKAILKQLKDDITIATGKYMYVEAVAINKTLKLLNSNLDKLDKHIAKHDIPLHPIKQTYDYVTGMATTSLTQQKIDALKSEVDRHRVEYKRVKAMTPQKMWYDDLKELKAVLKSELGY